METIELNENEEVVVTTVEDLASFVSKQQTELDEIDRQLTLLVARKTEILDKIKSLIPEE